MDEHSNEPLVFESQTEKWFGVGCGVLFTIIVAFLFFYGLSAGTLGEPVAVIVLFFVGMAIWAIVRGFKSRHLGGRVIIENGFVRVYNPNKRKPDTLIFVAPYSEFEEVQVRYHEANEGGGPSLEANLIHKSRKFRRINLFFKEGDRLNAHDKEAVARVAQEIGIPILDDVSFFD